jgi:hypothetical protein
VEFPGVLFLVQSMNGQANFYLSVNEVDEVSVATLPQKEARTRELRIIFAVIQYSVPKHKHFNWVVVKNIFWHI